MGQRLHNKFCLLLWKNYILLKRHKVQALFEICILPLLFNFLLVLLRSNVRVNKQGATTFSEFDPKAQVPNSRNHGGGSMYILYAPNTTQVEEIVKSIKQTINEGKNDMNGGTTTPDPYSNDIHFLGFVDEASMVANYTGSSRVGAGTVGSIIFKTGVSDSSKEISYRLRFPSDDTQWLTDQSYPEKRFSRVGPRQPGEYDSPGYKSHSFLWLQFLVDNAIIQSRAEDPTKMSEFSVTIWSYPYPEYEIDGFLRILPGVMSLFITFSFCYAVANIAKLIVHEREGRIKESMKMMGLSGWVHWSAWLARSYIVLGISVILLTLVYKVGGILKEADGSLLFVFFLAYIFSVITFAFLISSISSSSHSASTMASFLFFFSFLPYYFLGYYGKSTETKLQNSLLSNTAMGYGCYIITEFEKTGEGIQWSTIGEGATPDDTLSMFNIIGMLILDGFLYLILAIYVEAVFPGEFGVPLPFYYPILPSYWCGGLTGGGTTKVSPESSSHITSGFFEKEPEDLNAGIQIIGLRKVFGSKVAVDGLELNFYENQVTALLGHNGAGKTTTMSMITGLYRPTSGTALVNGFDIRKNIGAVRKSLGLCPQHDVLFDDMTVEEHLKFFCLLKGYDKPVQPEIERMLVSLKLENKRDAQSSTLSGGMKRKLSVGIALIGGSKVVLLDEPTAGMDPGARRSTWDLIASEREGRTILLSTHFMDEADLLGDRIAIMAHGRAICCGSSLFLKQKYGGGYHLIMVKEPNCQVNRITELLQKYIPGVNVGQNIGTELSYSLPDAKVSIFPQIFEELEKRKSELGVSSYGCAITQMEEVFMRVGQQVESELGEGPAPTPGHSVQPSTQSIKSNKSEPKAPSKQEVTSGNSQSKVSDKQEMDNVSEGAPSQEASNIQMENPEATGAMYFRNRGGPLLFQQLRAMLIKKSIYAIRHKILFILQVVVPVAFFILIAWYMGHVPKPSSVVEPELKELQFDLAEFSKSSPKPVTAMKCSLSPTPAICSTYNAYAGLQSTVENTGDVDLPDFILKKGATKKGLALVSSKYIVGLQVGNSGGRTTASGRRRREAAEDDGADPKDKNEKERQSEGGATKLIGFYNGQPYHAAPITLNFISNTMLRNRANNPNLKLIVSHHPLPKRRKDNVRMALRDEARGSKQEVLPLPMLFIMSFLVGSFILFPIKEREAKSKHLQFVSGVPFPIFWLGHLTFDGLYYLFICILIGIVPAVLRFKELGSGYAMFLFFLILVMFGWAAIPMTYLLSLRFTIPATGYLKTAFLFLMLGLITSILSSVEEIECSNLPTLFSILLPSFNLYKAIDTLTKKQIMCENMGMNSGFYGSMDRCKNRDMEPGMESGMEPGLRPGMELGMDNCDNFLTSDGIGKYILFLFISGSLCYALLFLIESKLLRCCQCGCCRCRCKPSPKTNSNGDPTMLEDSDVIAETERIRNTNRQELFMTDTMVLKDMTKYYGSFLAVDNICLGVEHGECFGLLGINGAGKTTTFKMLTGDISITYGDAWVSGKSVKSQIKKVQQVIGYCPQFDALIPELTGRETIQLYARLRGIPDLQINGLVDVLSEDLLFAEHINKPCGTYSGGNKRKLSTAISLIGNPVMIFLDEPTAGMDPVARRHLWNTVIKVREGGSSVVLTSHSMDECEALCTRLAIMVNGKFRCLGSAQHLKNKFGDGYTLIAQLQASREEQPKRTRTSLETGRRRQSTGGQPEAWEAYLQPLRNFIEKNFSDCQLKDMHPCYVHYHIPMSAGLSWGQMFKKMEEAKEIYQLEAYSVGQTSLEQVFLGFAKGQCNAED